MSTGGFDTDDFLSDVTDEDVAAFSRATSTPTDDEPGEAVDDVEHAGVAPDESVAATPGPVATPEPQFANYAEFMVGFVGQVISRKLTTESSNGLRWDEQWWRYPEALYRAELMWRTFEVARIDPDPSAMESWTRTVLDYHLNVLLNGATGPMNDNAGPTKTLPMTLPPVETAHEQSDTGGPEA